MRAHWRYLANTIELVLTSATRAHNPNYKSMGSVVFTQLAAEFRLAHWHHLANTIELVLPTAYRVHNQNGKSIG